MCCRQLARGSHMSSTVWNFLCVGDQVTERWLLWLYTQKRLDPLSLILLGRVWTGQQCSGRAKVTLILHTSFQEGKSFSQRCCKWPAQVALLLCFSLLCAFIFGLILLWIVGYWLLLCQLLNFRIFYALPCLTFCKKKALK